MSSRTITRTQLKDLIEHGIRTDAELLGHPIQAALREVGDTAQRVAIGGFVDKETACCCPIVQAGLYTANPSKFSAIERTEFAIEHQYNGGFFLAFDGQARREGIIEFEGVQTFDVIEDESLV